MAYLLYTPPTRDLGMTRDGQSQGQRAVARIAQPMRTGWSLLRTGGTWSRKAVPTQDDVDGVDTHTDGMSLYLAGGHWHLIEDSIYEEIIAAGLWGTFVLPDSDGETTAYPSSTTYPSATLYPGAA